MLVHDVGPAELDSTYFTLERLRGMLGLHVPCQVAPVVLLAAHLAGLLASVVGADGCAGSFLKNTSEYHSHCLADCALSQCLKYSIWCNQCDLCTTTTTRFKTHMMQHFDKQPLGAVFVAKLSEVGPSPCSTRLLITVRSSS